MYPLWWKSVEDSGKEQMNYLWQMYSRRQKLAVLWVVLGIIAVIFYADTFSRLRYEKPLYVGKVYALHAILGNENQMIDLAGSKELVEKIRAMTIEAIGPERLKDEIATYAWKYDLQLYKAERLIRDGNLIATYGFFNQEILDEAFTYTVELSPIGTPTLWDRSIGKLFMSEHKTSTPKWVVVDYYTASDTTSIADKWDEGTKKRMGNLGNFLTRMTEDEVFRIVEGFEEHLEEMDKKEKDRMKTQNKEVRDYLRIYIKEYKEKGLRL